ncbi:MAG TPA: hypothetical protein VNA25_30440 [Phycisphaerae bacterium]|nr:hypothetical protein [Phycisphaerae bacterium]
MPLKAVYEQRVREIREANAVLTGACHEQISLLMETEKMAADTVVKLTETQIDAKIAEVGASFETIKAAHTALQNWKP